MSNKQVIFVQRLLRDKHSGCFFQNTGDWTEDRREAMQFPDFASVLEACRRFELHDVELVLRYKGDKFDLRMDLSESLPAVPT